MTHLSPCLTPIRPAAASGTPDRRRAAGRILAVLATWTLVSAACPRSASADEYTDRVNAIASDPSVSEKARSDLVLLPLLAKMQTPPAVLRTQERAALFADQGPGWAECAAWAQAPAQKAIIDALDTVTKETDRKKAFVFGQPYGIEGVSVDLIKDNMYTELGDPPLLAAAQIKYMPALENAGILCEVEATRRLAAGEGKAALKVLTDWLFFCRQMADRPMLQEKKWAMESMRLALERMRDLAYTDMQADKHVFTEEDMDKENDRIGEGTPRNRGFLQLDRLTLPEGDFIAREQLVRNIMGRDGEPSEKDFAPLMARASSTQRPLKLFSAAAFWEQARRGHASERETSQMLKGIHDDWEGRWVRSPFDKVNSTASDYRKRVQTTTRFAALSDAFNEIDGLFSLRQQLRTELAGTRMAVAVYGYFLRNKTLPTGLSACVPRFARAVDKDPYSPRNLDLPYFVPMRDTNGNPYTITLYPPPPNPEFKRQFNDHVFVLYSVGPDGLSDRVSLATQTRVG
ncbi:MAG TPA: hypothetical protein VHC70_14705, partial [Phycisphaerales bacterium]|nr:hypothetical protein [Phycisphaerales bacterium]